jgi:hypothetical protein
MTCSTRHITIGACRWNLPGASAFNYARLNLDFATYRLGDCLRAMAVGAAMYNPGAGGHVKTSVNQHPVKGSVP